VAHQFGVAVGGIEATSPAGEASEFRVQALELADALVEVGGSSLDERADVFTRRLAPVTEPEDPANLSEGKAAGLSGAHEGQSTEGGVVVVAVAVR
jgi:hypothetical protein